MKSVQLTAIRQMKMAEVAAPQIKNDDDVLLKIECMGVCGSDVHYYETGRIGSQVVQYPFVVGHECAATVKEVGKKVKGLKVGDRVVVEPAIVCGECDQCRQGRENTCRKLKFLGCPGQVDGCLSEYIVMPAACCLKMPDNMTFEQGVICEPLAIGVYSVKQSQIRAGSDIAILGAGPIGLSCMIGAKAAGVKSIFMTDKIAERVVAAGNNGAKWSGNPQKEDVVAEILKRKAGGMDVVFECAGQPETIDEALELLKPGGRLMLIGIPREDRVSFIIDRMRRKEITVVNIRRQNKCTEATIEGIASGAMDVDFMITHRFTFGDTQKAFDLVAGYEQGVIKALIDF